MRNAFVSALNDSPSWWRDAPGWWSEGIKLKDNDTSSPRSGAIGDSTSSRLGRTMARHGYLDSRIAGKRRVTSGYRNFALGSLNSDHLTGAAYDLVGQNLVGYGAMVNSMGGFAEFHGSGADRHLHVVPGQTPVGDSMSPVPAIGSSSSTDMSTTQYNIQIYTQPNQDTNAIAAEVMARIEARDRSNRERA